MRKSEEAEEGRQGEREEERAVGAVLCTVMRLVWSTLRNRG